MSSKDAIKAREAAKLRPIPAPKSKKGKAKPTIEEVIREDVRGDE